MLREDLRCEDFRLELGEVWMPIAYTFERVVGGDGRQLDSSRDTCSWCQRSGRLPGEVHVEANGPTLGNGSLRLYEALVEFQGLARFWPDATAIHVRVWMGEDSLDGEKSDGNGGTEQSRLADGKGRAGAGEEVRGSESEKKQVPEGKKEIAE